MGKEDLRKLLEKPKLHLFPGLSDLESDFDTSGLSWTVVSEASADQELANTLGVVEEKLPAGVANIRSHIEEIAGDMKLEISRLVERVGVQIEMIHRVPHSTRSLDTNAYDPQFVSFGPYHRYLSSADDYKWYFLGQILNMNKEVPLEKYLEEMDRLNQTVKSCYEEDIEIETNDQIKMLLLDGCCILGFLGILPLQQQQYDSSMIMLWHHDSIRRDLLMLENQLPFIVLQKIYDLATEGTTIADSLSLIQKVDGTIEKLLKSYPVITTTQSFHHLLHCCHLKFKPDMAKSSSSNSEPTEELERKWRGAMDLYKAGIKFKLNPLTKFSLLDVQLVSGRVLMIPTLKIEDSTRSIFRNLIAFEQSCTGENYFAAYAFFMGELMSTPGDVTLLVKKGIVKNYIGADKEVSDFFNNLVKGVGFNVDGKHFLRSTFKELNNYYNSVGNKYAADIKQNYCGSPWLVISMVVAAVLLVSTVVQAVFSVIK